MKLGIVITTSQSEAVFNALRLANFAVEQGNDVGISVLSRGVELERMSDRGFDVVGQVEAFVAAGGRLLACGRCLKLRKSSDSDLCPASTMEGLHGLVRDADKVVSL